MKKSSLLRLVACAGLFGLVSGCASTKVTSQTRLTTEHLPRPGHIWVYDFAATAADLPPDSALTTQLMKDAPPQTHEEIEHGRKLGALVATELVGQIRGMGMPAEHWVAGTTPQVNDILIRGCLISFDEGDAEKRVRMGFGKGASKLHAAVEGMQVTAQGISKLGSGSTDSGGGKTPGVGAGALGLIITHNPAGLLIGGAAKLHGEKSGSSKVEGRALQTAKTIAGVLKKRFKEEGWISR